MGQSLQIVARRKPPYVCNAPIAAAWRNVAKCQKLTARLLAAVLTLGASVLSIVGSQLLPLLRRVASKRLSPSHLVPLWGRPK
jgi:hypothetical protein